MAFSSYSLLDLCSKIVDNRGKTCPVGPEGRPLIATNCVKSAYLYPRYETVRFVAEDTYKTWFRGHPEPGDLIFVVKGSPGEVCLAPDPVDFCIAQDMVALRPNPRRVYPRYLFALLRSHEVRNQIGNMHVGSLIPHFKKGDFDKLEFQLPNSNIQRYIGDLYVEFSMRIDVLAKSNGMLEDIARTIFKSWFVDFDPVRAKAEGREPEGMDAATADLFPCGFADSQLGAIPDGWGTTPLYGIADFSNGAAYKNIHFSPTDKGLPVIKIAELKAGVTASTRFTEVDLGERYRIEQDETLFSWSGNPDTSIDTFIWDGGPAWLNQHIFRVRESGTLPRAVIYFQMKRLRPIFAEIARDKQTTGLGHVTVADMKRLVVCLPSPDVVERFDEIASPILRKIALNQVESRALALIRDTLLPRLISGKLRVPEAEKLVEAVL